MFLGVTDVILCTLLHHCSCDGWWKLQQWVTLLWSLFSKLRASIVLLQTAPPVFVERVYNNVACTSIKTGPIWSWAAGLAATASWLWISVVSPRPEPHQSFSRCQHKPCVPSPSHVIKGTWGHRITDYIQSKDNPGCSYTCNYLCSPPATHTENTAAAFTWTVARRGPVSGDHCRKKSTNSTAHNRGFTILCAPGLESQTLWLVPSQWWILPHASARLTVLRRVIIFTILTKTP